MRSIPNFNSGGHIVTRFFVAESAYPGEFFIYVDDDPSNPEVGEKLENLKAFIRSERKDPLRKKVQRYNIDEVRVFLGACQIAEGSK